MAWYLSIDDEFVRLGSHRIVGRNDFVDAPSLSKNHLKFTIEKGVLTVRDLGSTNGTRLGGLMLLPNETYALGPGDALVVDELELKVDYYRPNFAMWLGIAGLLFGAKFVMPDAAWGRAMSRFALLSFAGSAVAAATFAVILVHFVVPTRFHRAALAMALVCAFAFDFAQVDFLARRTRLVESLVHRRLEHFCLDTFDGRRCVAQVQLCPKCAVKVEKWKRDLIVRRLAAADKHQPLPTK